MEWERDKASQFYFTAQQWENNPESRRYSHQLFRAKDPKHGLAFDAVLCVEGQPTAYFKVADSLNPDVEASWHRSVWNQGAANLLVVEDENQVRIYSALAKPNRAILNQPNDPRLVVTLNRTADELEISGFIRSVETGAFYLQYKSKFEDERTVDYHLLANLRAAGRELCDPAYPDALSRDVAHATLGRVLFASYLLERGIIGPLYLETAGAPAASTLWQVLDQLIPSGNTEAGSDAPKILFELFRLLNRDFKGSMFGSQFAQQTKKLTVRHLDVIRQFLRGDDLAVKQIALGFGLYDFRFIPIELISSIYESFLAAEDASPEESEDVQTDYTKTNRREAGAYYTPPRLAELMVNIATQNWETFLDKRCLDPSCGSGVFLVILFQRMAEEWRRRNPEASNVERGFALRQFLTQNVYGVDRNKTACMVACFSLYLAYLDQFDPPDLMELRGELQRRHIHPQELLPPLMPVGEDIGWEKETQTIFADNFFSPALDELKPFDLVIGNPPWSGRQQSGDTKMEKWLGSSRNPFRKSGMGKVSSNAQFYPTQSTAIPFMWKAPCHVSNVSDGKKAGIVCLLLPSSILLGEKMATFQASWFKQLRVDAVWQLADLRYFLFRGGSAARAKLEGAAVSFPRRPSVIIKYSTTPPTVEHEFAYLVPKTNRLTPRQSQISVLPEDDKALNQMELAGEAKHHRAYLVWKKHFWGTSRDVRFLDRLSNFTPLSNWAGRSGKARWTKGVGYQPFHHGRTERSLLPGKKVREPIKAWWDPEQLYYDGEGSQAGLILLPSDCRKIGTEHRDLRTSPHRSIFTPPLVVFNRSGSVTAFTDFPVIFQDKVRSISAPSKDKDLLLFLTAVLHSDLAQYFLFHTSSSIAVERTTATLAEYLGLPFPRPEETRRSERAKGIVSEAAKCLLELKSKLEILDKSGDLFMHSKREQLVSETKSLLNPLVLDYYDLNNRERVLLRGYH